MYTMPTLSQKGKILLEDKEILQFIRDTSATGRLIAGRHPLATEGERERSKGLDDEFREREITAAMENAPEGQGEKYADEARAFVDKYINKMLDPVFTNAKKVILATYRRMNDLGDTDTTIPARIVNFQAAHIWLHDYIETLTLQYHFPTMCMKEFQMLVFYLTKCLTDGDKARALVRLRACHRARAKENALSPQTGDTIHKDIVKMLVRLDAAIVAADVGPDMRVLYFQHSEGKRDNPVGFKVVKNGAIKLDELTRTFTTKAEAVEKMASAGGRRKTRRAVNKLKNTLRRRMSRRA